VGRNKLSRSDQLIHQRHPAQCHPLTGNGRLKHQRIVVERQVVAFVGGLDALQRKPLVTLTQKT
jgi:hypothetical protein